MCCEEPLAFASLVGMAPLASLHVQAKGLCWTAWPGVDKKGDGAFAGARRHQCCTTWVERVSTGKNQRAR